MKNPVPFLRIITLVEAISYLVLLGIAMPLKYIWHLPIAVKIAGSVHGLLFITFCLALLRCLKIARWPVRRCALIFAASFVPVIPFFLDRQIAAWSGEFERNRST